MLKSQMQQDIYINYNLLFKGRSIESEMRNKGV